MALSRYYQPANYEYISQHVPKNLGLMDRGLQRAQAKQDKQVGKLDELSGMILKQKALPEFDTKVRDQIVGEVKSFSDEMASTDLTNPENFRKVNQFVQQYANDERLQKIEAGLASKAKYDKIKEDLLSKKDAYATENDRVFMKEYEKYLTQPDEGSKFAIDYIGGKELIEHNAPSKPELEKIVDNMKASGYTYDKERGLWKDRHSNTELSYEDLMNVLKADMYNFKDISAGRQMARRAGEKGRTYEEQFLSEVNPIAMERAYKTGSDTFTSNVSHLLGKKKLEETIPETYTQDALTSSLLKNIVTKEQGVNKVAELRATQDPDNLLKADLMEGQLERFENKWNQSLVKYDDKGNLTGDSKNKIAVVNMTFEQIKDKPELVKLIFEAAGTTIKARDNKAPEKEHGDVRFKKPTNIAELQNQYTPEEINELTREVVGKQVGVNYPKLKEERDNILAKGEFFENKQILLEPNKAGLTTILESTKALPNYVGSINYESTPPKNTNFGTLEEAVKATDYRTFNLQDGPTGPEFVFQTKKTKDMPSETWTFQPKEWSSATERLIRKMAGDDRAKGDALINKFMYKNVQPLSQSNTRSQSQEIGLPETAPNYNLANSKEDDSILIKNLDNKSYIKSNDVLNMIETVYGDVASKYGADQGINVTRGYLTSIGLIENLDYTVDETGNFKFEEKKLTDKEGNFKFKDNTNAINYLQLKH